MSSTLREIQSVFYQSTSSTQFWVIMLGIIALFVVVGPFGTYESMSLATRSLYWPMTMLGSWLIAITIISAFVVLLRATSLSVLVQMIIAAIVASAPIGLWNWFASKTLFPNVADGFNLLEMIAVSVPITIIFSVIAYFALRSQFEDEEEVEIIDTRPNLLMERLPIEKRGPVQSMSMQDHYVVVSTTRGTEMVLMRMADAVAELSSESGEQIHRSHWVNTDFVAASERDKGQHIVVMKDGKRLPVSRTYIKAARAAGII